MKSKYNFKIKDKTFMDGTHVMAILNATPDSFFKESRLQDDAVKRAGRFIADGAEILDIGGQSTRPGATKLDAREELRRVLPAVEAIRAQYKDIPISVDTFFPEVAKACIKAGADMINDVSCLAYDDMAYVIASTGVSVCIMHDRRNSLVDDLIEDKVHGLSRAIGQLVNAGVDKRAILLDGGIGFNKNHDEDWLLLREYKQLIDVFESYPFLLGTSRKSMFGGNVDDRLQATLDSTLSAVQAGVLFVRVHDVAQNKAIIDSAKR